MSAEDICYHWWWVWDRPLSAEDRARLSAIVEDWARRTARDCAAESPPRAFLATRVEFSEGNRRMEFFTESSVFHAWWMGTLDRALRGFWRAAVLERQVEISDELDGWYPEQTDE